ncbi:MAG: YncE family protein [Rudaea sp.]|nr:YncE family protein [Rudaea sp.]
MKLLTTALFATLALTQTTAFADARYDYQVAKHFDVGEPGGWDYLTADADHHRLFISRSDRVMVIDTEDGKALGTIADTQGVHAIVLVPALGHGYTSNGRANTITEFDLATLKIVRTFPAGGQNPDALLFDAHSKHLFAFDGRSKEVTVIDPVSARLIARIPAGGKPEFAASDGHGRVFVNIEDTSELKSIDSDTNKVVATWKLTDCEEPSGLALDSAHQRLFSVCQNGRMAVTDARTGKHVASVAIGRGPDAAAFDAGRGLVFSSNGQDGTLTVIHEDSADNYRVLASVDTQKSARTMALNPANHNVYLVAAEFGPVPAPTAEQPHPRPAVVDGSFRVLVVASP